MGAGTRANSPGNQRKQITAGCGVTAGLKNKTPFGANWAGQGWRGGEEDRDGEEGEEEEGEEGEEEEVEDEREEVVVVLEEGDGVEEEGEEEGER